ncbi:glucosaminidase domain-containing protein [Shouchella sp. 1P09AA]|uniref:glucosaminidase domain-containing protein n=1 Tax=unclassified Shouchella TaxID=2893065 RepID=UPI0039A0F24E
MKKVSIILLILSLLVNVTIPSLGYAQESEENSALENLLEKMQHANDEQREILNNCIKEEKDHDLSEWLEDDVLEGQLDEATLEALISCVENHPEMFLEPDEQGTNESQEKQREEEVEPDEQGTNESQEKQREEEVEPDEQGTNESQEKQREEEVEPDEQGTNESQEKQREEEVEPDEQGANESQEKQREEEVEPDEQGADESQEKQREEEVEPDEQGANESQKKQREEEVEPDEQGADESQEKQREEEVEPDEQGADESQEKQREEEVEPDEQEATFEPSLESYRQFSTFARVHNNHVSSTSKLGHLYRGASVYEHIGDSTSLDLNPLLDYVYYIKQEASVNGELYYLLSSQPSATNGTIGWAHADDVNERTHHTVSRVSNTYYINGNGRGLSKAWGGHNDVVLSNLDDYKNQPFTINLKEHVGNTIWYRGTIDGQTVFLQENQVSDKADIQERSVSKLGHLYRGASVYENVGDTSSINLQPLLDYVYFIKREATYNGDTYYLLSTQPSAINGVVGWAKASDVNDRTHSTVSRSSKKMYIKGTGRAVANAWGGHHDVVYENLTKYQGEELQVNLEEKVGNETWYRGVLDGKTVFVRANQVEEAPTISERSTSRLGHLHKGASVFKQLDNASSINVNQLYDTVYYIKREATYRGDVYYLLSTQPSATNGTVGWAKASDVNVRNHRTVSRESKELFVKGNGRAYTKAWGGHKDVVYSNLDEYMESSFLVNLTETVGDSTWYRGMLNGQQVWLHENQTVEEIGPVKNYSPYNITLDEAVNRQYGAFALTDTYTQYVSSQHVRYSEANRAYYVDVDVLNVRSGPSTAHAVVGQVTRGERLSIRRTVNGWHHLMWVRATKEDIAYHMNPTNFINDYRQQFQFLDLSKPSGATASVLNQYLEGKGNLSGQGQAFIDAGLRHGVNDIYLLSHAILETGHGGSTLAKGIEVNGKTVYNMFGIGARDNCPIQCGSQYAYDQGWDTPYKAIVGGASFIGNSYIKRGQNTLYKMRWNPAALVSNGRPTHQYATDIGWSRKQVHTMYNLYQEIGAYSLTLDIPEYKG